MATLYQLYGSSYWPSGGPNTEIAGSVIQGIFLFLSTILFWIYKSATPGKMLFKVKIVDAKTGNAPTVKQAVIRYIGYYISILPMGLGLLWICWDKKKQGWHDKLAGTVVIGPANRGIENGSFSENNT
jgi:uncharacterized RDD family membrane protein YckC